MGYFNFIPSLSTRKNFIKDKIGLPRQRDSELHILLTLSVFKKQELTGAKSKRHNDDLCSLGLCPLFFLRGSFFCVSPNHKGSQFDWYLVVVQHA